MYRLTRMQGGLYADNSRRKHSSRRGNGGDSPILQMKPAMTTSLELQLASNRVDRFSRDCEHWKVAHQEAMECRRCEDTLKRGVEALKRIRDADSVAREAACQGIEVDEEFFRTVRNLYEICLGDCESLESLINRVLGNGYNIDHLCEFRAACEEARNVLDAMALIDAAEEPLWNPELFADAFDVAPEKPSCAITPTELACRSESS